MLVSLGVTQYPKGRAGVFGKKVVLGTGHEERVRFLTAEHKLLEVLPGEPMKWQAALDNLLWQLRGDRRPATVP